MRVNRLYRSLAIIAVGLAAITTVTCDPHVGTINLFRDDDQFGSYYDDYFVPDVIVDDCFIFECYF